MENKHPLLETGRTARLGCYAALPGSGPAGAICSRCALLEPDGSRFVCRKYHILTGRKGKPIVPDTAACRYFEPQNTFAAPAGRRR
jgi:hypothetical protein